DRVDQEWKDPQMVLAMITRDGENRRVLADMMAGARQGFQFGALDVHLDERRPPVSQVVTQGHDLDVEIAVSDVGRRPPTRRKAHDPLLDSERGPGELDPPSHEFRQPGHTLAKAGKVARVWLERHVLLERLV